MHVPSVEKRLSDAAPWGSVADERQALLVTREAPLAGQVLKGMLLTILTLGIYRFWYKTRLRRYYWSNTTLLDEGFEYTGTGKELLIGFLIALAVLVPLNFSATIIGLFAGELVGNIVGGVLAAVLLPILFQVWLYRARRYRLARTRYRGIRFMQSGTAMGYFGASLKWLLLSVLTLGITVPYLRTAMQAYKINNTWFGKTQASFHGEGKALMKSWLIMWFLLLALVLVGIATGASQVMPGGFLPVWVAVFLNIGLGLALLISWMVYQAGEFRYFTGVTRFGEIGLQSDVVSGDVVIAKVLFYLALIGGMVGILVVSAILGTVFSIGTSFKNFGSAISIQAVLLLALPWIIAFFGYSLISELWLRRKLWRLYASSITLTNISALDGILQAGADETGAFGEAFDTGFDVAG